MNDLLTDSFVLGDKEKPKKEKNIEMGLPISSDSGMEPFFKQVRELEKQMDKLTELLQKLQDANEETKSVTKASTMKGIKQRMAKDIDEVGKIARKIKAKLDEIDKDNAANRQKPGCGKGTASDRSRVATTNSLKKKLKERMTDFQILRKNIQDEYREVVERRVFTVTGNRPDEETIDELIDTGNSEQIFQKAIQEMGRGQVLDTVEEIQERHDTVKEIEKKLLDLHQVFLDMAVLVQAQGDLLDNIEIQVCVFVIHVNNEVDCVHFGTTALQSHNPTNSMKTTYSNVTNAVDHVQSGNDALKTAKSLQKKSRKCMMIAIFILLIIAIIVVLSILKPWNKGNSGAKQR
ncbi:hypothetical protein IFM89_007336 [Coptis chinensis]|uniref:t-SNARE coiled-coil homology domain-containing protein n=1 Tax=Coptis chinensis TaxID=261450 RepID=A0A835GV19_9MAGN|nr:hypothetical protein IFM89_007336 [Coptis chinensis]